MDESSPSSRRRARPRLELVLEASEPSVMAAPATHDLFADADDAQSVALTHIYVPVTVDPPRDLESQRRFDDFWRAQPMPTPEPPPVFMPLFPRVPLYQRKSFLFALLGAAGALALAMWIGIFVLLSTSGTDAPDSQEDVETAAE